ncbi:TPA: restriction endonuclease subunit S [Vibrio parahaemolyticus]|nr:restriction endonuclease subunit S [Vibrio parahaemolyticus]
MVPNVSLAELLDLSQYGLSVSSVDNGQYPMFKMNNFRNGFMSEEGVDRVNLDETEFEKYRLEYGDILFNRTNSIDLVGKTGIFTLEGDYVFASYLVKLKVNRDVADPFYLNYFMNFDATKLRLRSLATKAVSQANINPTQLKKLLKVPLLPLPEQRKIAKILSTWDKAISTTEKLIETSKQQKKALMQQLLTGKKRLRSSPKDGAETGKAFEGEWEDKYLNDFSKVIVSPVDKKTVEGEIPVELCNYTDVYYNTNITQKLTFMKATAKQSEIDKFTLEVDDVIITKDSETPGDIAVPALVSEDLNGVVCGYHLAIVRTDKQQADGAFINYLFSMPKTRYYFFTLATGATRFGLSIGGINKAHFCLPPLEEQQKIASVLTAADKEIEVLETKLAHFKQEKKALMQQLLTGKRRVKVNEDVAA